MLKWRWKVKSKVCRRKSNASTDKFCKTAKLNQIPQNYTKFFAWNSRGICVDFWAWTSRGIAVFIEALMQKLVRGLCVDFAKVHSPLLTSGFEALTSYIVKGSSFDITFGFIFDLHFKVIIPLAIHLAYIPICLNSLTLPLAYILLIIILILLPMCFQTDTWYLYLTPNHKYLY